MKKKSKLAFGLLIAIGVFLAATPSSQSDPASATQAQFIECPANLVAPYGGDDGWSTIQVQANFARAIVSPKGLMTCQYGFCGRPPRPFFGIQKPCPAGFRCIAVRNGFRLVPIR